MKNKTKVSIAILSLLFCISIAFCLVGCQISDESTHTHSLVFCQAVEPICNTDGNIAYWQCADCGECFLDENGNKKVFKTIISKTGHTSSDWIIDIEPKCTSEGLRHKECVTCKTVLQTQSMKKAEHTSSDWIVDVKPDCQTTGERHTECETCKTVLQTQSMKKTEHTSSDWIVDVKPDCQTTGERHTECETCKTVLQTQSIEKINHIMEYVNNKDDSHSLVCKYCFLKDGENENHTYENDICVKCHSLNFDTAPLDEYTLGQEYSEEFVFDSTSHTWGQHLGVDFLAEAGSQVKCIFDGVIKDITIDSYSDAVITIEHEGGFVSIYKYIDKDSVTLQVGDKVSKGDIIGYISNSALEEIAVGAHLHLELKLDGKQVDPLEYLKIEQ